jgi:protein phosphatase
MSHPGMRGKNNEDRYGITAFRMEKGDRPPALLAVLCDGIGGHRAGEVAAEIAVNRISAVIEETGNEVAPLDALQNAIQAASEAIYQQAQANRHQEGMGATCVCAWIIGRSLYLAGVGDTRAYLLRDSGIRQLTTDHTWVQEAIDKGVLTRQEAEGHPNTHVIRRFLGSPQPPVADLRLRLDDRESDQAALANQGMTLQDGDLLLLCSDGLTDLVSDEEIAGALYSHPVEEAAAALIELANSRGGHDNITLVIIQVPHQARSGRRQRAGRILLGVLILLAAGALAGWWLDRSATQPTPTLLQTSPTPHVTLELPAAAATQPPPAVFPTSTFPPLPTVAVTPAPSLPATLTPWPTNTPNS